jgi:hypothetical protein
MKSHHTISELLKPQGLRVRDIHDYSAVHEILQLYRIDYYDTMNLRIRKYGDFLFFKDLCIYLDDEISNENYRNFIYKDIVNLYVSDLDILVLMKKDKIRI